MLFKSSTGSFFNDILHVSLSNVITLLGGIVTGLLVPSMLGTTNYGYYRMFLLYSSYAALLHFGFVDGVMLKFGGKSYNSLNKIRFRSNSQVFFYMELVVTIIIILLSSYAKNNTYAFLFIAVSINIFLLNISSYYQLVSQATLNFKGYSIRNSLQSILNIICTLVIWVLFKIKIIYNVTYRDYVFEALIVSFALFSMCIYTYRNITIGKRDSILYGIKRVVNYCKIGIYLTISYQISNLILIIDNQIVSMFFRANIYGEYSFSYTASSTIILILNALATVLLPHLKRDTFSHMINIYHKMVSILMILVYFALLGYFPLVIIIKIILPEYIPAISYLRIFLPELGIICSVTMITFNYYNALDKSKFYFYMSLVVLAISIVIDSIMYMLFHDPILVAFGSFIAIFIWYLASEYFLVKWYHVQWVKNLIYMMLMIGSFFVASMVPNLVVGFGVYLVAYVVVSWSMFKKIIKKNMNILIRKN